MQFGDLDIMAGSLICCAEAETLKQIQPHALLDNLFLCLYADMLSVTTNGSSIMFQFNAIPLRYISLFAVSVKTHEKNTALSKM